MSTKVVRSRVRTTLLVALALLFASAVRAETPVDGLVLARRLDEASRPAVERAVSDIEASPRATANLDVALREAARACEDVLADPARAVALYDRILAEFPDGSASHVARGRASVLRGWLGTHNVYARQASELAALARANDPSSRELVRRAEALSALDWPGAADAALLLAGWFERTEQLEEAHQRYAAIELAWPGAPQADVARRAGANVAIAARDWPRAERLARRLTAVDDRVLRDTLLDRIQHGRNLDRWYRLCLVVFIGGTVGLVASLLEAFLRGRPRRSLLKPPVEVYFLLPIAAVLVGAAFTTHSVIARAVCEVAVGGLVIAWLSGATLEQLRLQRRALGVRALISVLLCVTSIGALGFIVWMGAGLLEM